MIRRLALCDGFILWQRALARAMPPGVKTGQKISGMETLRMYRHLALFKKKKVGEEKCNKKQKEELCLVW